MSVLDHAEGCPLTLEEHASGALAGGIVNNGYQCGMLWGAALAAGAESYRVYGPGPKAEAAAVMTAQKLVPGFCTGNKAKSIDCMEIIGFDIQKKMTFKEVMKFIYTGKLGGMIGCLTSMGGKVSKKAFKDIEETLSGTSFEVPAPPVSCASLVAQRMGATDMHTVMVAGFASGVGLSGDACGALGAAIWFDAVQHPIVEKGFTAANARAREIVNQFLKASDYKFECEKIVGRKFTGVNDHAVFLRNGGCAKIIDTLASIK